MNEERDKIKELTKQCMAVDREIDIIESKAIYKLPFGNTLTSILSFCRTTHINSKKSIINQKFFYAFLTFYASFTIYLFLRDSFTPENSFYFEPMIFPLLCLASTILIAINIIFDANQSTKVSQKINNVLNSQFFEELSQYYISQKNISYLLYKLINIKNILKMDYDLRENKKVLNQLHTHIERLTHINKSEGKSINLCSNIDCYLYIEEKDVIDIISDETIDLYFFINMVDLNLKAVQDNLKYLQLTPDNLEQLIYNIDNDFYPNHEKIQLFFKLINNIHINEKCTALLEKIIGIEKTVKFTQQNKFICEDTSIEEKIKIIENKKYLSLQK